MARERLSTQVTLALATAIPVAATISCGTVLVGPIAIVGATGIGRVVAVVVIAVPVIAMTAGIAVSIPLTVIAAAAAIACRRANAAGSDASTSGADGSAPCSANSADAVVRTNCTGSITAAATAARTRGLRACRSSPAARTRAAADAPGSAGAESTAAERIAADCAGGIAVRTREPKDGRRAVADRPGDAAVWGRRSVHSAQGLRPNGTAAGLLTLHDVKSAVVIHGGISDRGDALLPRSDALGAGRSSKRKEKGRAGQSKSV